MNWHVARSPHTIDTIIGLPVEAQLAVLDPFETLEVDPFAVAKPYGIADKIT
ncbi:hypothetical protein [Streptomyces sp. NPDC003032]